MNTSQDNPASKKRIFLCYVLWMTTHLLTAMPIYWFLLITGSNETDSPIAQLRVGDLSVLPPYIVLLLIGLVIGAALAFLGVYVLGFRWPGTRYFMAGTQLRWILWGVLSGMPHGFLIRWKQQADSPLEAAFSATGSFIAVPLIIIVTFWISFRFYPLPKKIRQGVRKESIHYDIKTHAPCSATAYLLLLLAT